MKIIALLAAGAAFSLAGGACAQSPDPHAGHAMPAAGQTQPTQNRTSGDQAKAAFEAANMRMHQDMAIAYSGDPDVDFVRNMIPHHQGAVDMARIELQYGKDPALKKLAQDIVSAQEMEIAFLQEWLKKHAH